MSAKTIKFNFRPELAGALIQFIARGDRHEHPDGKFDRAKRWSPSESCCSLCNQYRPPSRAYPFSAMLHCRTAIHTAGLNSQNPDEIAALAKACRSKIVSARNYIGIVQCFSPRRRPAACAAMLAALWIPRTPQEALDFPGLFLCDLATTRRPSKRTAELAGTWISRMITEFSPGKYQLEFWPQLARLHCKLSDLSGRVGIPYLCPPELLAYAI